MRVLGLKKWTLRRLFLALRAITVFTAFAVFDAFFAPSPLAAASPSAFFDFGGISLYYPQPSQNNPTLGTGR